MFANGRRTAKQDRGEGVKLRRGAAEVGFRRSNNKLEGRLIRGAVVLAGPVRLTETLRKFNLTKI
jgi:hypothetical protein